MIWRLLRRPAAFRADRVFQFDAAFGQRLAQQAFELGIDAPQIGRGRALDRRIEGGIETQRKRLFGGSAHPTAIDRACRY